MTLHTLVEKDYSRSIIYKICCKDTTITDEYIGSTTGFKMRTLAHKTCSKNSDYNLYKIIRENGGWDNWETVVIEEYSATSKEDLLTRERYWVELLFPSMNTNRPIRTTEELKDYYIDNREKILKGSREYYLENKERIKDYRIRNYEKMKIYNTEYRAKANTTQYAEKFKGLKIECECGSIVINHETHLKSKKHKKYEENQIKT